MSLKSSISGVFRRCGYEIRSISRPPSDFDSDALPILEKACRFTMTRMESLYSLVQSVRYIEKAGIPGAVVECGVYMGGCMLAAALTLESVGSRERDLYLFDTFEGMTAPTAEDGETATLAYRMDGTKHSIACRSPLEQVEQTMAKSGYPANRIHYIKGKVEDTLPGHAPGRIALLRLDTDWYQSTKHELVHLFPLLAPGGVLVIDDYGHWEGSRRACDEYFAENRIPILLQRIDPAVRCAIKL
jgi:O-methyltransferase